MSYSSLWDSKIKVAALPYSINTYRVCYNCLDAWLPEQLNVCTGLCPTCAEKNIVSLKVPPKSASGENGRRCNLCNFTKMQNSNFGIVRESCRLCLIRPTMVQRCIHCDEFRTDCWNNICRSCRYDTYLCDKTGQFYSNVNVHFKQCWCLEYNQRILRYELTTNNLSTS